MFTISHVATPNQERKPLVADRVEMMGGQPVTRGQSALVRLLSHVMTKATHFVRVLGRLRKVRVEVSVDLHERQFDNATR